MKVPQIKDTVIAVRIISLDDPEGRELVGCLLEGGMLLRAALGAFV